MGLQALNPHCETILKFDEDKKIILPAIKALKKNGFKVYGPFSADTIFLKQNRKKYDVILGMYHDQVLSPIKTLNEYDAINITLGLPFIRVSPDHGPNKKMIGKNLSNPLSLTQSIKFLDKKVIKAKKSLGQNFLIDKNIIDKITDIVTINNKTILEVGPGMGHLTESLIKKIQKKFYVVEKDNELVLFLQKKFHNSLNIINDDILNINENLLSEDTLIVLVIYLTTFLLKFYVNGF